MGLDYVYSCGDAERSVRFSEAEWSCIERLGSVVPAEVEALFNAPVFGEPESVAADELAAGVDALLALLESRRVLLPATYQMRMERLPNNEPDGTWVGGAISGLRLPGESDFFMIRVGPDRCEMQRIRVGPDGRGMFLECEDLRHRDFIQTETVGRIDFRRRSSGAGLRKRLVQLRSFFASLSGKQVSKSLC